MVSQEHETSTTSPAAAEVGVGVFDSYYELLENNPEKAEAEEEEEISSTDDESSEEEDDTFYNDNKQQEYLMIQRQYKINSAIVGCLCGILVQLSNSRALIYFLVNTTSYDLNHNNSSTGGPHEDNYYYREVLIGMLSLFWTCFNYLAAYIILHYRVCFRCGFSKGSYLKEANNKEALIYDIEARFMLGMMFGLTFGWIISCFYLHWQLDSNTKLIFLWMPFQLTSLIYDWLFTFACYKNWILSQIITEEEEPEADSCYDADDEVDDNKYLLMEYV